MSQFFQAGYECDTIKIVEMINDDQNTDAVRDIIKGIISSDKGHTTQADTLKFLNQQLNGRLSNYFNEKGQSPLFFDAIFHIFGAYNKSSKKNHQYKLNNHTLNIKWW